VAALVDASNSVASTLVDAANWLQQPATHVPIAPEIAAGEPDFPMGAAWVEATDPTAFRDSRPVSHLEVAADAVGAVGAVIPAARAIAEAPEAAPVMRFSSLPSCGAISGQLAKVTSSTTSWNRRLGTSSVSAPRPFTARTM
jgi:hypothetical protein